MFWLDMNKTPETSNVIGRRDEQEKFGKALTSAESEFIAVYGRRRVGKTFLIREFFGKAIRFELTGMQGASVRDQLVNFASALARAKGLDGALQPPATWQEAFGQLARHMESLRAPAKGSKHVIFLDELPWLDTARAKFCPALEHFWNSWASKRRDLLLVIYGSAASWMVKNLVEAKGGLHNRVTRKIRLLPFTLGETRAFLRSRGVDLTDYQVIELFMALGGVPFVHSVRHNRNSWSKRLTETAPPVTGLAR